MSPPTAAFCSGCGARLTTLRLGPSSAVTTAPESALLKGERRTITVMLSDLSGYTAMNERLDPEDVAEIMALIKGDATRILESFGGIVNQFVGDEIVGLFGVPTATAEDARRAVSAAIDLHAEVRRITERVEKRLTVPLRIHTGIQTGLMVAERRDQRSGVYELTGDAINTAARLRNLAERDEIVVGQATHQLIEPYFETEAIGAHTVRGKAEAVRAFRVLRQRAERSQFDVARDQGLTPWTGRQSELAQLERAFAAASEGRGSLVSIEGEAGAGKSRLCHEFLSALRREPGRATLVLTGRCDAYGTVVSYQPFIQMIRAAFEVQDGDGNDAVADKIASGTIGVDTDLAHIVPVLLHLMSVRSLQYELPADMRGDKLPLVIQRALIDLLLAMAEERTVLLHVEDWHWADDASRATLIGLAREISERGALVVVTHRPLPPGVWGDVRVERVALELLPLEQTRRMIGHCLRAQSVQAELADKIYERTLGNPFFIEEICASLVQQGRVSWDVTASFVGRIEEIDLPATVQSVVLSRVDALEPRLRDVLRIASVIGREFAADLLVNLVPVEWPLGDALSELARLNFILPLPQGPPGEYRFKHATTQEVTYGTLMQRNRAQAHQRVAELIEGRAVGQIDDHVEALAHHYQRAGNDLKAIEFLERAGRKAAARYELGDARRDLRAAIECSEALGDDDGAARRRIALAQSWAALCIFAPARDQLDVLARALRDAEALGDRRLIAHCLYWMAFIHYGIGDLTDAETETRQVLGVADAQSDELLRGTALCHLGTILALRRDSAGAEQALTEGMKILDEHSRTAGVPVGARYKFAVAILGLVNVDRGEYRRGNELQNRSLGLVREDGQRSTEASNLITTTIAATLQSDWGAVVAWAEQAQHIAEHLRAPFHLALAGVLAGYASFRMGDREGGMNAMTRSIQMHEESGALLSACLSHACVADAASRLGDWETALRHASASLARGAFGDAMGDDLAHRALLRYEAHVVPDAVPARIAVLFDLAEQRDSTREHALADLAAAEAYLVLGQALPFERHASAAARLLSELGPAHLIEEAAGILGRVAIMGSSS